MEIFLLHLPLQVQLTAEPRTDHVHVRCVAVHRTLPRQFQYQPFPFQCPEHRVCGGWKVGIIDISHGEQDRDLHPCGVVDTIEKTLFFGIVTEFGETTQYRRFRRVRIPRIAIARHPDDSGGETVGKTGKV